MISVDISVVREIGLVSVLDSAVTIRTKRSDVMANADLFQLTKRIKSLK
jgi:hypothetical protein